MSRRDWGSLGIAPFDVHAHTGTDVDGAARSAEEHVEALAAIDGRSVIFPLCVTGGYERENRRVAEECVRHEGTLVPFARLDPRVSAAADAEAALAAGVGFLGAAIVDRPAHHCSTRSDPLRQRRALHGPRARAGDRAALRPLRRALQ